MAEKRIWRCNAARSIFRRENGVFNSPRDGMKHYALKRKVSLEGSFRIDYVNDNSIDTDHA